jgi:hypothetical protein
LNKSYPPELDNHCSNVCMSGGKNLLIILCGFFGGNIGLHSNCVFSYDLESNNWERLYP